MKRTKYAGEIRYQEFVGCRVTLALKLEVPSRFMVGDSDAISSWLANFINKRRGRQKLAKLEDLGHHLAAWVASSAWSEKILRDAEVQEALPRLFHADSKIRRQQSLSLDPLQLTYGYRMKSVDLEALDALIPPFLLVAKKVKQAEPPPRKTESHINGKLSIETPLPRCLPDFVWADVFAVGALYSDWIVYASE